MSRLKTIFNPIIVFVGVQIAWVILMAIWINWYLKNRKELEEFAKRLRPELFSQDLNWVILLEGCFLMMVILVGVALIFVFWNKQARLNRLQSNFVSSVSHELKSPLTSIQLYLETMKYQKLSPEEIREFVEVMLTDTERLSSLINNILEAGSSEPKSMQLKFQAVDMKEFLNEVIQAHQRQFEEKNFTVHLETGDAPILYLDKRAMRMVFNNLVGNALRYSPKGSALTVRVHNDKKFCNIEFTDTGMGFDDKERKKIFKKFYRTQKPEVQDVAGAGLGLYISREFVKLHKGKISASSPGKGKGATFTVSLPLRRPD